MYRQVDKLLSKLQQQKLSKSKRQAVIRQIVELLEQDVAILPLYEFSK